MIASRSRKAVLAHSGGPTAVINASLLGVVEQARETASISKLYGARFGIPGILAESFIDLSKQSELLLDQVARSTASALGCSRHEVRGDDLHRVLDIFRAHDVGYFFYTGGNGSMGTAHQLKVQADEENFPLQIIGIPKTIDNDLVATDHTPGYASTARFFAHAARDIGADNRSLPNQVEIIEVLGRNTGWLAAATCLAKSTAEDAPHLIYLPEQRLPLAKFLDDVQAVFQRLRRCVVVVCEGQLDGNGEPFGADVRTGSRGSLAQNLGHRLASLVTERLGLRARSEKPGLLGRSSSAYVTQLDWDEARLCGRRAVELASTGQSQVMVTLLRQPGTYYAADTSTAPLADVAFTERMFPSKWIDAESAFVHPEFRHWAQPLIGDVPKFASFADMG